MSEGRPGPVLRHIAFQPADGEFDQRLRPRFAARVHGIISMKSRKGDLVSSLRKRQSSRYERLKRQAMHRSEEHTSELQSLMRISYAVFCLKKKKTKEQTKENN